MNTVSGTAELLPAQFTSQAEEAFYAVVDSPAFFQRDGELIYRALRDQLKPVSFGDYLKRYICRKAEMTQAFNEVPLAEYQDIIAESFADRGVPASFAPTTVRIRQAAKNWLTRQAVSRDAVLLMGFGLRMSPEDVEELLVKGLQETKLNMWDVRELICGYCYAHGLGFHRYASLMDQCREMAAGGDSEQGEAGIPLLREIRNEKELLRHAAGIMKKRGGLSADAEARRQLLELYSRAQAVTASALNAADRDMARLRGGRQERFPRLNDPFCGAAEAAGSRKPEDVTSADVERVMQAAIPRDRHGNLLPMRRSALYSQFRGRRLSRQRMEELLSGETTVSRYDLLMLQFFVYSQKDREGLATLQYYRDFLEETNRLLERCGMGPVYAANPFECFLLMCILSQDPLGTYADVMEQSYMEDAE